MDPSIIRVNIEIPSPPNSEEEDAAEILIIPTTDSEGESDALIAPSAVPQHQPNRMAYRTLNPAQLIIASVYLLLNVHLLCILRTYQPP